MLDRVEFLISEAWSSLRRNVWMTFAAVTTVAMALYILGSLGFVYTFISGHLSKLNQDFKLSVFLVDGLDEEQMQASEAAILAIPGVTSVDFVSKDQAFLTFQEANPDIPLDDFKNDNPFPDSYEVQLEGIEKAAKIAESIEEMEVIDEVRDASDLRRLLVQSQSILRLLGVVTGGLMLLTGGVLIYNTIVLTIYARRKELSIMKLVGAARSSISGPLIIEGAVQGAIGGLLAALLLSLTLQSVDAMARSLNALGGIEPTSTKTLVLILTLCGAFYGMICSIWAVKRQVERA